MLASPGAIALRLGPLTVRWYGVLLATALAVGFLLAHRRARWEHLPADDILRVAQLASATGVLVAIAGLLWPRHRFGRAAGTSSRMSSADYGAASPS